jgi:hypothetical protein
MGGQLSERRDLSVRIRFVLTLMVAGLLMAAGVASAQDTTTQPLSDYTTTTPTVSTPTPTPTQPPAAVAPESAAEDQAVAPAVASQPAGRAPSQLAFTGAEPLLLIALGLGLAGGATMLIVRDRRRSHGQ